jgi:hypothetical protein
VISGGARMRATAANRLRGAKDVADVIANLKLFDARGK